MISKLDASGFATYATNGKCENSDRSRRLAGQVKKATVSVIESAANNIVGKENGEVILSDFLNPQVTLVPVPRSSPLRVENPGPWPSLTIAEVFLQHGLGQNILSCVQRITAVPKSQFAGRGNRPTVDTHLPSLDVQADLVVPDQITLIDDVITKGSTTIVEVKDLFKFLSSHFSVFDKPIKPYARSF